MRTKQPWGATILNRMLERVPNSRYQSAREIIEILDSPVNRIGKTASTPSNPASRQANISSPAPTTVTNNPSPSSPPRQINSSAPTIGGNNPPPSTNPTTPSSITRNQFLKLLGYGGVGTITFAFLRYFLGINSQETDTPSTNTSPPESTPTSQPSPSPESTPTDQASDWLGIK